MQVDQRSVCTIPVPIHMDEMKISALVGLIIVIFRVPVAQSPLLWG